MNFQDYIQNVLGAVEVIKNRFKIEQQHGAGAGTTCMHCALNTLSHCLIVRRYMLV